MFPLYTTLNSLQNNKILSQSKLTAFADDKVYVTKKIKFIMEWVETIMGKGENAGHQHFLLFSQCI